MTKVLLSHPPRPASHNSSRAMVWVRKNLFSSWSNSLADYWLHMVDVGTDPTVAELGIFARLTGLAQRVPTAQKPVPVGSSSTNDLVSLCMGFTHTTNAGELTSHY